MPLILPLTDSCLPTIGDSRWCGIDKEKRTKRKQKRQHWGCLPHPCPLGRLPERQCMIGTPCFRGSRVGRDQDNAATTLSRNKSRSDTPSVSAPRITPTAINDTSRQYSTADAPFSSFRNAQIVFMSVPSHHCRCAEIPAVCPIMEHARCCALRVR